MKFLSRYILLIISVLTLTTAQVLAEDTIKTRDNSKNIMSTSGQSIEKLKKKRLFSRNDILNLCETMKVKKSKRHAKYMDILIKNAGITKEQWNKKYFFEISCVGGTPLYYALRWQFEDFKLLADYGIDLNHAFKDDLGDISTVMDYVKYKYKNAKKGRRVKWRKVYNVLRAKGAKDCKQQPELKCTAIYL